MFCPFLLVIVLSVLFRFTASDIALLVSSNFSYIHNVHHYHTYNYISILSFSIIYFDYVLLNNMPLNMYKSLVFCVVLLCVFTFLVPCCNVRYDFQINTMFGSALPPVVCTRSHVLFTHSGVQHNL
jgi:hypothetical protein